MSCHYIYIADGVKKMRPICSREEYLKLRNGGEQAAILKAVRSGDESRKKNLGEFTKSGSHPEVYNIPSHEAIENMKRLCIWLHFAVRPSNNRRKVSLILT